MQTKLDAKLLEEAVARVLKTFFTFVKKIDKKKPTKPKSQVMWRARGKAQKHLQYWIDEQNDLEYFNVLRTSDDVARNVFKKASERFKIKPLDHRMWKRGTTKGKAVRRDDPYYRRSLCRWFAKVMTVVYAMGTPKNGVPLSYSQPKAHLKNFRAIAGYHKSVIRRSKQCLTSLSEHGLVLKELCAAWSDFLPLELLYPMLSVEQKSATKQASLTVNPVSTGDQGDQVNEVQSVVETYASPPRIVIDLED